MGILSGLLRRKTVVGTALGATMMAGSLVALSKADLEKVPPQQRPALIKTVNDINAQVHSIGRDILSENLAVARAKADALRSNVEKLREEGHPHYSLEQERYELYVVSIKNLEELNVALNRFVTEIDAFIPRAKAGDKNVGVLRDALEANRIVYGRALDLMNTCSRSELEQYQKESLSAIYKTMNVCEKKLKELSPHLEGADFAPYKSQAKALFDGVRIHRNKAERLLHG